MKYHLSSLRTHQVIFFGENNFMKTGLEALMKCRFQSDNDIHELPEGMGLLIISLQECSTERRVKMLSLVQSLRSSPGWKGLVFVDSHDVNSLHLARLTGLPSVDLMMSLDTVKKKIIQCLNHRQIISRDSVGRLTQKQWSALQESLNEETCAAGTREKLFYVHRQHALSKIRFQNIHQLRVFITAH